MHPEIMRELIAQRNRDLRERAQSAILARSLRAARRGRGRPAKADEFVVPAIPDYVDGSFAGAGDEAAAQVHSRVPAARRAA
jgi:hypothetical protein